MADSATIISTSVIAVTLAIAQLISNSRKKKFLASKNGEPRLEDFIEAYRKAKKELKKTILVFIANIIAIFFMIFVSSYISAFDNKILEITFIIFTVTLIIFFLILILIMMTKSNHNSYLKRTLKSKGIDLSRLEYSASYEKEIIDKDKR